MRKLLLLLSLSFTLTGCYDELKSVAPVSSTSPYISPDDFAGVDSAINLTTGIQVSWLPANPAKNILGYRVYRYSGSTPLLIATVGNTVTTYIDGNVISGSKYQYMVRTVDPSNAEDTNTVRASTLAWAGLTSVIASDLDKITLSFDGTLQGVTLRFYIQRNGMDSRQLVKNLTTPTEIQTGVYVITNEPNGDNLRAGAEYTITAEVYETGSIRPDGNTKAYVVSTKNYGYDGVSGQGPGWKNVASVRAFGRAADIQQPANTNMIPNSAQIDIGFLPFNLPTSLATSKYRYVIFRFGESEQINTASVTDVCPATYSATTSKNPCIISDNIDPVSGLVNGLFRVQDNSVWISTTTTLATSQAPPRYRYTMALRHLTTSGATTSSYVEAFPMPDVEKFSVAVPVPPDYMVLVNRESANFEFCYVQRKSTPDPLKKNRCQDSEVGNKPLNSGPGNAGLNLEDGYYDFGYNLFVDRYPLACNADTANDLGDFTTTKSTAYGTRPLGATGGLPDVSYSISGSGATGHSSCNYRDPVTGRMLTPSNFQAELGGLAGVAFARTLTNKPDGVRNKFKFSYPVWSTELSQQACENFAETGYGSKRVPRLREYRALMAPPFQQTIVDLNVSDFYFTQITAATTSSTVWSQGNCLLGPSGGSPTGMAAGIAPPNLLDVLVGNPNGLSYGDGANSGPRGFAIGTAATAYCISKYGVSDILETPSGNANYHTSGFNTAWYPVSDYFLRSNKTPTTNNEFKGLLSPIDSGNIDVNTAVDFTQTGYVMMIGTTNTWRISTSALTKFNLALGLPIMSNSSAYAPKIATAQNYGQDTLAAYPTTDNTAYYGRASSRYSISFSNSESLNSRVRCVLPAD
jgi:hypothetical protein